MGKVAFINVCITSLGILDAKNNHFCSEGSEFLNFTDRILNFHVNKFQKMIKMTKKQQKTPFFS